MKRLTTIITSALLCITMLTLAPAQVIASAADNTENKYLSEVKVGMGETSDQASKDLLAEGYTILKNDKGEYADLNKDAGSKSEFKSGPNQKIVYLGYKTTANANEAITDLAVMNMDGGYSYEDYEKLMNDHMDTQIKPFVDRFIATLKEYRENLKKPQDSANYKRANYYKTLLNKLTDDDTGAKPLGNLLVNETKYEMGDEAYNKLSGEEKNHCDILTLLMQGNGQAVQLMETLLTKSADSSSSTWLDRFMATDLEKLTEAVKKDNPDLTPSEINRELDKKYNDDAKRILDKWGVFNETLLNYDTAKDKANEVINSDVGNEKIELNDNSSDKEVEKAAVEMYNAQAEMVKGGMAAEDIVAHDYLEATEFGDGTLLKFFERDKAEFDDEENIRELYPIVESLTGGQLAGLDFLSIKDMILLAITDEKGFNEAKMDDVEPASIYQDVNREIYEKGGVALTDDALRAKATAREAETSFELSKVGVVLWSCTAAAGIAAAASAISIVALKPDILKQADELRKTIKATSASLKKNLNLKDFAQRTKFQQEIRPLRNELKELKSSDDYLDAADEFASKSSICKYLSAGFTVIMAVLAGVSIYTTIKEYIAYYKVDFAPIPKYIVDRADITAVNQKGETVMIKNQTAYYKAVLCNRTEGGGSDVEKKNYEILKDRNDLNGDVGMQWLSLYSVKYENGTPILADSLKLKMGSGDLPEGYTTGIHKFGEKSAFNLTFRNYCYNDPYNGTYVYFKNEAATVKELTASGSAFSAGSIAIGAGIGLLAGCAITLIIVKIAGRKKKKEAAQA